MSSLFVAVKSVSWFKDKHAGYSLPDNKYFTAGVAQQVYRFPGRHLSLRWSLLRQHHFMTDKRLVHSLV